MVKAGLGVIYCTLCGEAWRVARGKAVWRLGAAGGGGYSIRSGQASR